MEWVNNQTLFFFYLAFPIALERYSEHMLLCGSNDIKVVFDCLCPSQITKTYFIVLHAIKKCSHAALKIKQFNVNWGSMPKMFTPRSLTAATYITWTCWLEGKFEEWVNFKGHKDFWILLDTNNEPKQQSMMLFSIIFLL